MAKGRDFTQNATIQGKLRSLEKRLAEQKVADRRRIMLTPEGRRFVYELIFEDCGLMNLYPAQDSGIYRHEGMRSIGHKKAQQLQVEVPDLYVQMINEQVEEAAHYRKMREAAMQPATETDDA